MRREEAVKKGVLTALFVAACVCPLSVSAAVGDIAGEYYSSDIVTTLNGVEISSINVGGKTLISAEDMQYYGFSVYWYGDTRRLEVIRGAHASNSEPPAVERPALPVGSVLGYYYETDIVTTLDGKPITAYNIGGRTYLLAEQMTEFGYSVEWDGEARTLSVESPDRAGYLYSVRLTAERYDLREKGTGSFAVTWEDGVLAGRGDTDYFSSSLYCDGVKYILSLSFYQNGGLFYSDELLQTLNTLTSSGYGMEYELDPAEKYDEVNKLVTLLINGQKAENMAVSAGAGNGHRDFIFTVQDIPRYTWAELQTVYFAVGEETDAPMTPILLPEEPRAQFAH